MSLSWFIHAMLQASDDGCVERIIFDPSIYFHGVKATSLSVMYVPLRGMPSFYLWFDPASILGNKV